METFKGLIRIFICLLIYTVIVAFVWSPHSHASENYSFDTTSNQWKINVVLKGEQHNRTCPVDAVFVDHTNHDVIILHPGKNRGIHYPCNKIKEINFINSNGHHNKHIINHH